MPSAAGSGAAAMAAGSGAATAGNLSGVSDAELVMLRQACVDGINMYRAMLPNLKPLVRATPEQEACGDRGAQMDGDSMQPHGAARAGLCSRTGLTSENTCGGFPGGNYSALLDSLNLCLRGFWAEGEPPGSRQECMMDVSGCYQKHGHYLNMSDANVGAVACSFYKMQSGSYWFNHDFAYAR